MPHTPQDQPCTNQAGGAAAAPRSATNQATPEPQHTNQCMTSCSGQPQSNHQSPTRNANYPWSKWLPRASFWPLVHVARTAGCRWALSPRTNARSRHPTDRAVRNRDGRPHVSQGDRPDTAGRPGSSGPAPRRAESVLRTGGCDPLDVRLHSWVGDGSNKRGGRARQGGAPRHLWIDHSAYETGIGDGVA